MSSGEPFRVLINVASEHGFYEPNLAAEKWKIQEELAPVANSPVL